MVESQLGLVLRTQVVLSLSGIVITVTGFGPGHRGDEPFARICIISGLFLVLFAAAVGVGGCASPQVAHPDHPGRHPRDAARGHRAPAIGRADRCTALPRCSSWLRPLLHAIAQLLALITRGGSVSRS